MNHTQFLGGDSTANDTLVKGGGKQVLGGLSNATFKSIANRTVLSGDAVNTAVMDINTESVSNNAVVNDYGVMNVNNGGTSNGTMINSGGVQNVNAGAVSDNDIINLGGIQNVFIGSTVTNVIMNGGIQNVENGASADNVSLANGSTQIVKAGGNSKNVDVLHGGVQDVYGEVEDITVNTGGEQRFHDNSIISGINTIDDGGNLVVYESGNITGIGQIYMNSRAKISTAIGSTDYIIANIAPGVLGNGIMVFSAGDIDSNNNYNDYLTFDSVNGSYAIEVNHIGSDYQDEYHVATVSNGTYDFNTNGGFTNVGLYQYDINVLGSDVFLNKRSGQYATFVYELSTANSVGAEVIQTLSNSMHKRLGELQWQVNNQANAVLHKRNALWIRNINSYMEVNDRHLSADVNVDGLEMGYDFRMPNIDYKYGDLFAGALAQIGYAKPKFEQKYVRNGDSDINTQAVGLYAIWLGKEGWFADAVVRHYWMKHKVHSFDNNNDITKYKFDQKATNATLEFGRQIVTSDKCANDDGEFEHQWFVTPKAQLMATILKGDSGSTNTGYRVRLDDNESYRASAGVIAGPRFWGNDMWLEPYIKMGLVYEFNGNSYSYFDNIRQKTSLDGLRYELGGGVAAKFSKQISAHMDMNWQQGENFKNLTSNLGLRYEFGE